ncbi:MAG: DegT/DnrJ/EryC1/StrS family aminotransferase, partial [Anaerolineae bacterium]
GRKVGTLADAAAFSFYPSKNLGAFGDAGAVVTREAAVADAVRRLRDGGQEGRYNHVEPGVNSRLDEIQAAVLRVRLRHLDADNDRRLRIAATYSAALAAGARVTPPAPDIETRQVHHLYVVRSPERKRLAAHLAGHGVATAVHYPTPLHRQGAFAAYRPPRGCPEAERAAAEVLSVPIFPELTDAEVAVVAGALAGA